MPLLAAALSSSLILKRLPAVTRRKPESLIFLAPWPHPRSNHCSMQTSTAETSTAKTTTAETAGRPDRDSASAAASVAGVIIIGDEILKGQTQDTNSWFLCRRLHSLGLRVDRVSVVADDTAVIAEEVRSFASKYKLVLTSGGIGPTHDDVTFEGVALAFGDHVELSPKIASFVRDWFGTDDEGDPAYKLARIPSTAKLNYCKDRNTGKEIIYPLVSVQNVFIFPGIPQLLRRAFDNFANDLFRPLATETFHQTEFFLADHETSIATRLTSLTERFPTVSFGSYPEFSHNYYKTKVTLECTDQATFEEASALVQQTLPIMTSYDKDPCANAWDKVQALIAKFSDDQEFVTAVKEALDTVERCFADFRPEEVAVCFNGGKDCIVMLHLTYAHLSKYHPSARMQTVYIRDEEPFQEVEDFILETERRYSVDALNLTGPMKQALQRLLVQRPAIQAAMMGTRIGDPGAHRQDLFSPTDGDWPKVMRVNPLLNWQYHHIWRFVRGLHLPYPALYDQGYTSLGNMRDTSPNPALRYQSGDGKWHYRPAHELKDGALERRGRK